MAAGRILTGMALVGALAATPAFAEQQRGRDRTERREQSSSGERARSRDRAVARSQDGPRQRDVQRQRDLQQQREVVRQREVQRQRTVEVQRRVEVDRYRDRRNDARRVYGPGYSNRVYRNSRPIVVRRIVHPRVVTVVPYRPYVYRPRFSIGVFYGAGGAYPYGYTPRGYYDPLPGRLYGGLRITDLPREAQVFADGYYVGIVDDFDGVFQHLNLEAGAHRIEVRLPGYDDAFDFDVMIQPGRTVTYRGDW